MIDYLKWKKALALCESHNDPRAWGDNGEQTGLPHAMGRWQMHPSFVWQWGPDDVLETEPWDSICEIALRNFFNDLTRNNPNVNPVSLAMWFHLHGNKGGGWDEDYAKRFQEYYTQGGA